jgi:hypothetical protein
VLSCHGPIYNHNSARTMFPSCRDAMGYHTSPKQMDCFPWLEAHLQPFNHLGCQDECMDGLRRGAQPGKHRGHGNILISKEAGDKRACQQRSLPQRESVQK